MTDAHALAAAAIRTAGALVVTAGAGMGVDSGLPDFRGDQGFWKAYPPYERLGISFYDAANPAHFERDPAFGWGFYGHRTHLYRSTVPHEGFAILQRWIERLRLPTFVITSNVDGQFQRAGFAAERVLEVHGSIHWLQCTGPCSEALWPNEEDIPVDEATMRARHVPRCLRCGEVARPNILMFGDGTWIARRAEEQQRAFDDWLEEQRDRRLVVIELGAGQAVPTIRWYSERLAHRPGATLVRVNPRESAAPPPHLSIASGAREALERIDAAL